MRNNTIEQKTNRRIRSPRLALAAFGLSLVLLAAILPRLLLAAPTPDMFLDSLPTDVPGIPVYDASASLRDKLKSWSDNIYKALKSSAAVAYRQGVSAFLNRIAYDTAVWIATGERGQKPLVIGDWGTYLRDTGEGAIGDFLNSISKDLTGVNLCTFSPETRIKLTVLARRALEPRKPSCPLNGPDGILANFNKIGKMQISDMIDFQKNFNPEANQIGAFLTITSTALQKKVDAEELAKITQRNTDFLASKSTVTGTAKSPPEITLQVAQMPLWASVQQYFTYTGDIKGDALKLFGNTLISKWLSLVKDKGLASPGGITNGSEGSGIAAAKRQLLELAKPDFQTPGAVDILNVLTSCPSNAKDRQAENCVIDERFRAAIDQHMTVRQAIDAGAIQGDRPFGFDAAGQEPAYNSGYPYRSLMILRKYRIVPSLWETVAIYLKNYIDPAKSFGIKELVDLYDKETMLDSDGNTIANPFYHLIDPDWVLRAPEAYCAKQGAGEQLLSDSYARVTDNAGPNGSTEPDGVVDKNDIPIHLVTRADTYCADVRTCISENPDGTCRFYGYCSEERPIWHFQGTSCQPYENTCTTYRGPDNKVVSYNQSTLDGAGCGADNAGCRWYCANRDVNIEDFDCTVDLNQPAGSKRNFDNGVAKCDAGGRGCDQYLPMTAGTNIAANSSFETFKGAADDDNPDDYNTSADHWAWTITGDTKAVSQPYTGSYSLMAAAGTRLEYSIETGAPVLNQPYALSLYAQGPINCRLALDIGGVSNIIALTDTNWQRLSVAGTVSGMAADQTRLTVSITSLCEAKLDAVQLEAGDEMTAYQEYGTGGITERPTTDNLVSNGSFSADNGTDYFSKYAFDNDVPYDGNADGWGVVSPLVGRVGVVNEPAAGYNDDFAGKLLGSAAAQDVAIAYGEEYDISAWVYQPGVAPVTTVCLDRDHNIIVNDPAAGVFCNLNAGEDDARTQYTGDAAGWQFVSFSVRNDHPNAAYVRIALTSGAKFDEISARSIRKSLDCRADEIGCDLYNPIEKGDNVPGIVRADDYCPAEFAGCKSYQQMPVANGAELTLVSRDGINTDAETGAPAFDLIADSGQQCEAAGVGCEEYTNLDEEARGGEAIQYYKYIRQCLKPDPGQCATFYRWQGTDTDGMELVAESLKSAGGAPDTVDGTGECDLTDPDCYTFYNSSGASSHRLYSRTISCSDDCHPLRNTLDEQIYNTIPAQSLKCSANQNNCREYRGSDGYNIRKTIQDTFEDADTVGWELPTNVMISSESVKPGGLSAKVIDQMAYAANDTTETGKSYLVEFWAKANGADTSLRAGFRGSDPDHNLEFPGTADLTTGQWNRYLLGPLQFDATVADDEQFVIWGGNFFIDNIVVWETQGNVYLKYGSYKSCPTAEVGCAAYKNRSNDTVYVKNFSGLCRLDKVGCTAAIDTHNSTTAFQSTVGNVTTMADTVRPVVVDSRFSCSAQEKGCTEFGLPEISQDDQVIKYKKVYLKDDPDTYATSLCDDGHLYCDQYQTGANNQSTISFRTPGAKTCEYRTGVNIGGQTHDAWFKSDSDQFCPVQKYTCVGGTAAGTPCWNPGSDCDGGGKCELYQAYPMPARVCTGPIDQDDPEAGATCYGGYRNGQACSLMVDPTHPTLGCDDPDSGNDGKCYNPIEICYGGPFAGQPCDSRADPNAAYAGAGITCGPTDDQTSGYCAPKVCQTKNLCDSDASKECLSDADCPSRADGSLGRCQNVECGGDRVCGQNWVGQCSNSANGCSEYRDPQSPSLDVVGSGRVCSNNLTQSCAADTECPGGTCIQYPGCNANCSIEYDAQGDFFRTDASCQPQPNVVDDPASYPPGCQPYYYIKDSVDKTSCAGLVDPDQGCWLFNDTTSSNGLNYDSDATSANLAASQEPVSCDPNIDWSCDSNSVIKVERDRTCQQWLYCRNSYVEDNDGQKEQRCLSVGNCLAIGKNGECIKPVGEGQCSNDPAKACNKDENCDADAKCILPPLYEYPDAPAEYTAQLVTSGNHPMDMTYPLDEAYKMSMMSGYSRTGITWGCSADGATCYRDGVCDGGENNGGLCRTDAECPGTGCPGGVCACRDDQCPGADNICQVVHGYYPTASMREIGFDMQLTNNDFQTGGVSPWEPVHFPAGSSSNTALNNENDPDAPASGNMVLSIASYCPNPGCPDIPVNKPGAQTSLGHLVDEGGKYVLNLRLRAKGPTTVLVQMCHNDGRGDCDVFGEVKVVDHWENFYLPSNEPVTARGVTGNTVLQILRTGNDAMLYIDDVKLQTVLEKKSANLTVEYNDISRDTRYVDRSCRLYPQVDSLQCRYVEKTDTAVRSQRGWNGYCLERDPQNSDICLQWWPVDLIKGEYAGGEMSGYTGAAPLYYCAQMSLMEYRRPYFLKDAWNWKFTGRLWEYYTGWNYTRSGLGIGSSSGNGCLPGYHAKNCCTRDVKMHSDMKRYWCIPDGVEDNLVCVHEKMPTDEFNEKCQVGQNIHIDNPLTSYWAPFDGYLGYTAWTGTYPNMNGTVEPLGMRCDVIARVVETAGQNKAWTNRIANGTLRAWNIGYQLDTDAAPFGSLAVPSIGDMSKPGTWDTDYTNWWGEPFPALTQTENQPIYMLGPSNGTYQSKLLNVLDTIGWKGGKDEGLFETDYLEMGRAGTPFSCRHAHPSKLCDDLFPQYSSNEQFSGTVGSSGVLTGGLGLKRLERLFADNYGIWVWAEGGRCDNITNYSCRKSLNPGDPAYALDGAPCDVDGTGTPNDSVCNVGDGRCSAKTCVGGDTAGRPCGCADGQACTPQYRCSNDPDVMCGLDVCDSGGTDTCTAGGRCVGGTSVGTSCTVANNCLPGTYCTNINGANKCQQPNSACDCPTGGFCQTTGVCRDEAPDQADSCTSDASCSKYCGGSALTFPLPGDARSCEDSFNCAGLAAPYDVCETVPNICLPDAQADSRCSNDPEKECQIADNCTDNFTCIPSGTSGSAGVCVSTVVATCDCVGNELQQGWCADGVCSEPAYPDDPDDPADSPALCASNNPDMCPGTSNTCLPNANICTMSDKRCDCDGGTCGLNEYCGESTNKCNNAICGSDENPGVCADRVCTGVFGADGAFIACENNNDCKQGDIQGVCSEAVCVLTNPDDQNTGGLAFGAACGSDLACRGVSGATCQEQIGVCLGGNKPSEPCNDNSECGPGGICADKVCVEGLNYGANCSDCGWGTTPDTAGICTCVGPEGDKHCDTRVCQGGPYNGRSCAGRSSSPSLPFGYYCSVGGFVCQPADSLDPPDDPNCTSQGGVCQRKNVTQYCQGVVSSEYDVAHPKYIEDQGFYSQIWHNDFDTMPQCRIRNDTPHLDARLDVRWDDLTTNPPDWCWVQPTVFNIKVNNRVNGDILLNQGSGQVVLKFNSTADPEQLPVGFTIDWGDGQTTTVGDGVTGFAPRSDPRGPYHDGFVHDYSAPSCAAPGCTIRVFAEDNWDRGSGYCGGGPAQECADDADCPEGYFGVCSVGGAACAVDQDPACLNQGGKCMKCLGVCRNADTADFTRCTQESACGTVPSANCTGLYDGHIIIIP